MKHPYEAVREFHEAFGLPRADKPNLPDDPDVRELRRRLMREEYLEYLDGEDANDINNIAAELADIIYIACGTAVEYGIPLDRVFDAIHEANMKKLGPDGNPIYREDGKILKPDGWKPANIRKIVQG